MWFIGLDFNREYAKNVDFTDEIRSFNELIERQRNMRRGGAEMMYNAKMQVRALCLNSECSLMCSQ